MIDWLGNSPTPIEHRPADFISHSYWILPIRSPPCYPLPARSCVCMCRVRPSKGHIIVFVRLSCARMHYRAHTQTHTHRFSGAHALQHVWFSPSVGGVAIIDTPCWCYNMCHCIVWHMYSLYKACDAHTHMSACNTIWCFRVLLVMARGHYGVFNR